MPSHIEKKPLVARAVRRAVWVIGSLVLLAFAFASLDLRPNLSRVRVAILSGAAGGNYYALVTQLADAARRERGAIENIATQGSVDNIAQLAAARETCRAHFGLVQDGLDWPEGLEFVARLPRSESVLILGRHADSIHALADLRGLRIGIGPEGSGTALLARKIFESRDLASLGVTLVNLSFDEELSQLEAGTLDLGVLVMDEDAAMIDRAVRERDLAIMSLPLADTIARRLTRVQTGRIGAGQYDPIRGLPPTDKTVLRVDTLIVGNGCARRTATTGLLTLLSRALPDFLARNRETTYATNFAVAGASRSFFQNSGADLVSEHVPWAIDIMPLSNWIYVITAVSLLFNFMGLWSRFRLWRIDARRVRAEDRLSALFGPNVTAAEIARLKPHPEHLHADHRAEVEELITTFEGLNTLCRRQSLSIVSDMGQEMPYRYQERLIIEFVDALRAFRARVSRHADDVNRLAAS